MRLPCNFGGGGIINSGTLILNRCTVSGNYSANGRGGGIANFGTLTVKASTLSGNFANGGGGGGISCSSASTVTVDSSTLSGNEAWFGGAIANYNYSMPVVNNSIVTGNTQFEGDNITFPFYGTNNLTSGDPLLAPLGPYGGPTFTMPPLPGSPALDAGNDSITNSFVTDQRGRPRLAGLHVDIGAVEGGYNPAGSGKITGVMRVGSGSIQFSFTNFTGMSFSVLATTNVALPASAWTDLGTAVENPGSSQRYQFTDPQATNSGQRYYRVRSP